MTDNVTSTPDAQQRSAGGHRDHGRHRRSHHHQHHRSRSQQGTKHLDFNQAMSDFKHMFPSMDSEIIEAVLRANNGAVDATIDQLLTMSVDFNSDNPDEHNDHQTHTASPASPPPFDTSFGSGAPPPYESPDDSSSDDDGPDALTESLRGMRIREQTVPKQSLQNKSALTSKAAYRHWNPPLIGKLPDDFLRLTVPSRPAQKPRLNTTVSPAARSPSLSLNQKTPLKTTITPPSEGRNCTISEINRNRKMLREKIAENAKQRRDAPNHFDAETARFLEDERLALMLQNHEFLEELKRNAEFMDTLEKDVKDERNIMVLPEDEIRKPDDRPEHEGYGDDNLGELGAFPHTKTVQQSDADFKSQLSNMGASSRKKFAVLASKFFSRRRKSKKPVTRQLLKDSSAPSTLNLLDDNDDEDLEDEGLERSKFNDKPVIEPLPGNIAAVPRTKTVQQSAFHTEPIVFYQDDDNFHDMV